MFVQVIEGRVTDGEALHRQLDRWMEELRPGAEGFLGTTAGVTDDGRAIAIARFDSAASARANSARAEQDRWWHETTGCFAGEVSFTDSEDVEQFLAGGSDDAGFVQVMKGHGVARDRVRAMDAAFEEHAADFRPDLLGGLRIWFGSDRYVEVAYFTSEADARVGEKQEPPAALASAMGEFEELMANVEFIDLRQPWLY
jgi:hypothetical protein